MFGDSWPRSTHQVRQAALAQGHPEEGAARIRNPEVRTQFQQRQSDALMKTQTQEAGASQQQAIPLLKIILVELPECRRRRMRGNIIEAIPSDAAYPAIIIRLDLEPRRR